MTSTGAFPPPPSPSLGCSLNSLDGCTIDGADSSGILPRSMRTIVARHTLENSMTSEESLQSSRSLPTLRTISSDLASRRELHELSSKFSDEVARIKSYCNKHIQTLCQMFETKVDQLEAKHPKLEWQMADLDGTVKALGHELNAHRKHSDSLDAAVNRLRKHFEEQLLQQESIQQYSRKLVSRVLHDTSPAIATQRNTMDQFPGAVLREEFESVTKALRREMSDVRNLCSAKPTHETLRQDLRGATELLREELRLEMRNAGAFTVSVQQIEEMNVMLGELRGEVSNMKAMESNRYNSDLQCEVAKLRDASSDFARKAALNSKDLATVQDQIRRCEIECAKGRDCMRGVAEEVSIDFALQAEQRCKAMESICLQNSSGMEDVVSNVARIKQIVEMKASEIDQLRDDVAVLRDGSARLREAYTRIADPRAEIHEMRNEVAVLHGEFASLGPRLVAVDRHLGELVDLRVSIDETRTGLIDLRSIFFCKCGKAVMHHADFCLQCGAEILEVSLPPCKMFPPSDESKRRASVAELAEAAKEAISGISRLKVEAIQDQHEFPGFAPYEHDGISLDLSMQTPQQERRPSFHSVSPEEDVESPF